jgi:hypothetical protein
MRQQRTKNLRTQESQGTPPMPSVLAWQIGVITDDVAEILVFGSVEGLVVKGVPAFREEVSNAEAQTMTVVMTPGGPEQAKLTVTFSALLPPEGRINLPGNELAVRNAYGGQLSAGSQPYALPEPPSGPIEATTINNLGSVVEITLSPALPLPGLNGEPPIYNENTSEIGVALDINGGTLRVGFGISGVNAGDVIRMDSATPMIMNDAGSNLAQFALIVP